jgi:hypothetical protein
MIGETHGFTKGGGMYVLLFGLALWLAVFVAYVSL